MTTTLTLTPEQMRVLTAALDSAQDGAHQQWIASVRAANTAADPDAGRQDHAAATWHRSAGADIRALAMVIEDQRRPQEHTS